jgi:hypothetical protein
LSLALIGTYALKGPFWALVSDWVPAAGAAAAIAQINALSNLAGFGATYLLGYIKKATGSNAQHADQRFVCARDAVGNRCTRFLGRRRRRCGGRQILALGLKSSVRAQSVCLGRASNLAFKELAYGP